MIKLSAIVITFNEEKNIGRCLSSLEGIADEVVVVDSFSTDRTAAICARQGVRFFTHPFEGHIEQKNYALSLASWDYFIALDADEALSPELRESIAAVKAAWTHDGYKMNRLTNYCGTWVRHGGWYPDEKMRLADRRKAVWTGINPHDRLEVKGTVGKLKGDILHYSYYTREDHLRQVEYFTSIASRAKHDRGERAAYFRMAASAIAKFITGYFLRLGFLDGRAGWAISTISARAAYLKYKKMRALEGK